MAQLRLTVRRFSNGLAGLMSERVEVMTGSAHVQMIRPVTIVVHGFNNSERQARRTYDQLASVAAWPSTDVAWFYWPGDFSPVPRTSAPYFGLAVDTADGAGERLARYIIQRVRAAAKPPSVNLIGHSLGCRVVLRASRILAAEGAPPARLLLLGAAVPAGDCIADLDGAFSRLPERKSVTVLHSSVDGVLSKAFAIHQVGSAHVGLLREAVGLNGRPKSRWRSTENTLVRHSGYFYDEFAREQVRDVTMNRDPSLRAHLLRTKAEPRRVAMARKLEPLLLRTRVQRGRGT